MVVQQKVAWFNLAVIGTAIAAFIILIPLAGGFRALGAFGICGLSGLGIFFNRRRNNEVLMDERDKYISTKANLIGLWTFWELFVAACMITWGVLRYLWHQETVSIDVLPIFVLGGWLALMLTQSIATLIQYGRSRNNEA
jgi:hypothetical protein